MAMATHNVAALCRTRVPLLAAASVVTHHGVFFTSRSIRIVPISSFTVGLGGFSSAYSSLVGQRLLSFQQTRPFSCGRVSMALKSGIVGLPNVGKSTLFNALVRIPDSGICICFNALVERPNWL